MHRNILLVLLLIINITILILEIKQLVKYNIWL